MSNITSEFGKFRLFALSAIPMWAVLLVKTVDIPIYFGRDYQWVKFSTLISIENTVALLATVMLLLCLIFHLQLNAILKGRPIDNPDSITMIEPINQDYFSFLASIVTLFSVILLDYKSYSDLFILAIIITTLYICFIQTNVYYSSPYFALRSFNIAKVNVGGNSIPNQSVILYRGDLKVGDYVSAHKVADNVYIIEDRS